MCVTLRSLYPHCIFMTSTGEAVKAQLTLGEGDLENEQQIGGQTWMYTNVTQGERMLTFLSHS